ncbi:cytochrome P450 [Bradyrhizobium sp. LTSPM299]|uniref:cytochrome P450 n=1 Tax=Bradyrhizobium sp. LTSPM299 TaxID=1619233 RepID=UPI0005CA6112|nr:cytochrome P450 [Bradyrhizobium sp. LTSPM299]KJC61707.1 cytochrome P450 [Bradyrhizobium sp. LTSPM299]
MNTTATGDLDIPADIAATLVDPAAYADHRIHDSYRWLRANNPLGIARPERFDPFWVVTKHAHILAISRQNELFHNADRPTTLTTQALEERVRKITGGPNLVRSLVQMDAPDHPKYRALTQGWFMPANLGKFESRVREIARATVQRMFDKGGACDFVEDVALGYPLHVIMEILGVPEADEPRMLKLTQELFGPQDPDTARSREALGAEQFSAMMQAVVADFSAYFRAITEDRRRNPREDLATVIANAKIGGDYMPEHDVTSYYMIVATAGHDTTSSSTAGAIWALAEDPDQFARVKANPELIAGLVDEAIRWMTPVKHFMRSATADTELGDRRIAKGDWLMLCYASGNRDEDVFEDPDRFRGDRRPNRHVAFGYGAHLCLGQYLAKLEMRILFEELLPRLKSLSLDGEVKMTQATFVNGPKRLPIRFEVN